MDFSFSKRERLEQKTKKKKKTTKSERNFLGSARSKGGSGKEVLSGWDSGWLGWTLGLHGEGRLSGGGAAPDAQKMRTHEAGAPPRFAPGVS